MSQAYNIVRIKGKIIDNIGFILYYLKGETILKFEVEFYETADGNQPARNFLLSLDKKMRAKMSHMIILLQDNGFELREPYSKHLGNGLFELRAKIGSDISRVLYFFYIGRRIILTNGYIKKSQKTPVREIERAQRYRSDYLKRKEGTNESQI